MGVVCGGLRCVIECVDTDVILHWVVINPAERNALVGIKPTVGLTSRAG